MNIRTLPADFLRAFDAQVARLRELANGPWAKTGWRLQSRAIEVIGSESELQLAAPNGQPVYCGDDVVAAVGHPWCTPECTRAIVEIVSDPVLSGPDALTLLGCLLAARRTIVQRASERFGARLVGGGLVSTFTPDALRNEETVSTARRYRALRKNLGARHGSYTFSLTPHDERPVRTIDVPTSPVPAGFTAGWSPNIQFHPSVLGTAANMITATAWTAPLVASTSPLAMGESGEWDSRVVFWQCGMDPNRELSPFGIGRYFTSRGVDALWEWLDYVRQGELILTFEESGKIDPRSDFAHHNLAQGTRWIQNGRLRPMVTESGLTVRYECRLPDSGLTLEDDMAYMAFLLGVSSALVKMGKPAEEYLSYIEAERAFYEVAATGRAVINWDGRPRSAADVFLNVLLPLAERGLESEGLNSPFTDWALQMLSSSVLRKRTGAHWIAAQHRASHHERSDPYRAAEEVVAQMTERPETHLFRPDAPSGSTTWH